MNGKAGNGRTGADIRAKLSHPVIDGDSHMLEFVPAIHDYLERVAGPEMVERYKARFSGRSPVRDVWWTRPSGKQTIDTLTAMLPGLYHERIDDIGFDFAVLYPSLGLASVGFRDDELRQASIRAINTMNMELFGPYADRMTPAALIPTYTPEEAIDELDFVVEELGYKAIMIAALIATPVPEVAAEAPHLAPLTTQVHSLCVDAPHDFDPFWRRCVELKVAPTCHTKVLGAGTTRQSPNNFVFNHLGAFASGNDFLARSLFMGGVTRRFPELNFAFLEAGVAWGCNLYNDIVAHWEKRNLKSLKEYFDPRKLDTALAEEMFEKYGNKYLSAERVRGGDTPFRQVDLDMTDAELDEFAALGIEKKEDIRDLFCDSFYFGCEADDILVPLAFDRRYNHFGAKLKATFSSDIGHWDVIDMLKVLPDAYALVEDGRLTEDQFRDFTFTNQVRLFAGLNPDFFKGTAVEAAADAVLAQA